MTTRTQTTPATQTGPDGAGLYALAAQVTETAAALLGLTPAQVGRAMALSAWTTAAEMIEREFGGAYRGYFPKCGMAARNEAVIAEVFDAIAEATGDPRRALRAESYVPPALPGSPDPVPATRAGGRTDG
jgi:phenylpyruvate tautomerase PptA (4-oxalocrotonate tautomerase family)